MLNESNDRAIDEPSGVECWNPALRGAYRKGYLAARGGLPMEACPYEDKRKDCGRITWSRAFIAAWRDGWDAGRAPVAREGEA